MSSTDTLCASHMSLELLQKASQGVFDSKIEGKNDVCTLDIRLYGQQFIFLILFIPTLSRILGIMDHNNKFLCI